MLRSIAHISCYRDTQYDIQNWTGYMRNRYFSLNAILAHCAGGWGGNSVPNSLSYCAQFFICEGIHQAAVCWRLRWGSGHMMWCPGTSLLKTALSRALHPPTAYKCVIRQAMPLHSPNHKHWCLPFNHLLSQKKTSLEVWIFQSCSCAQN